jgi:hypothetical protein
MKNALINILKKIHKRIPLPIRKLYMYFVYTTRKLSYYILPLYLYSGKEKTSGNPLKIAYLALDRTISYYWMNRLLKGNYKYQRKKIIPAWRLHKYFNKNKENYDLAIIETNNYTRKYAKPDTGFLIPRWFQMQLDTNESSLKRMQRHGIIRRVKKHALTFEKKYTTEDFKFFYQRMYTPYTAGRYKNSAIIIDYKYFINKSREKGSQLGFVYKDGKPVAGTYIDHIGDKFRMCLVGILDGREDILRMGVNGAIYYFEVFNCIQKGIKSINIGGTSPILTDGLTQFKLSLGAKTEDIKYFQGQYLWIIPLKDSIAIRNVLKLNPLIYRIEDSFYRLIFVDPTDYNDKEEFIKYINQINCGNIKGTKIYCFNDTDKIALWIKEEGYRDIQVMNYWLH